MLRKTSVAIFFAIAVLFLVAPMSQAQTVVSQFDLPPQPLAAALRALGSQTSTNVLFDPPLVEGRHAPALKAELTLDQAFVRLLAGTGLKHRFLDDKTVMVISAKEFAKTTSAAVDVRPALRLAQGEIQQSTESMQKVESTESEKLLPSPLSSGSSEFQDQNSKSIQTITVVGSSIRTAQDPLTSARPIQTITVEQFQRSSAEHIGEYIRKYSLNTGYSVSPFNDEYNGGRSNVNLRGIGAKYTLTLLDGMRMAGESGFADVGAIPAEAIEGIDILPGGASAVYGSDAVAGVVNLRLKKNFEGLELITSYGESSRGDAATERVAAVFGVVDERFSFTGSLAYQDRGGFGTPDRPLTALNRDFRSLGGIDYRSTTFGRPSRIVRSSNPSQPLTMDLSRFGPGHYSGNPSDYVPYNHDLQGYATWEYSTYPPQNQLNGHWSSEYVLLDERVVFFTRGYGNHRKQTFHTGIPRMTLNVPANNPYNPFGEPVQVTYLITELSDMWHANYDTVILQGDAGLRGTLGGRWNYEISAGRYRYRMRYQHHNDIVPAALVAAVQRTDALAFNPFGYGANTPAQMALIRPVEDGGGAAVYNTNRNVNVKVDGKLFDWYAGEALFALGFQRRELGYELEPSHEFQLKQYWGGGGPIAPASRRREVDAWFGEVRLPVWKASRTDALVASAELTGALRRERYDDFGSTTTGQFAGKIGLRQDSIILRASYTESFLAPTLSQLTDPRNVSTNQNAYLDPYLNSVVPVTIIRGGNPNLDPESGESFSLGMVFRPLSMPNTAFTLDYWKLQLTDLIAAPDIQAVLNGQSLSGSLTRDPVTQYPTVDVRVANGGNRDVTGLDASASYRWNTATRGTFDFDVNATYFTGFEDTNNTGARIDYLGVYTSTLGALPKLRATVGTGWSYGGFSANGSIHYMTGYDDVIPGLVSRRVGSYYTIDLQAGYTFEGMGLLDNVHIYGGLENALDADLPFVASSVDGWDRSLADLRGRYFYFGLRTRF